MSYTDNFLSLMGMENGVNTTKQNTGKKKKKQATDSFTEKFLEMVETAPTTDDIAPVMAANTVKSGLAPIITSAPTVGNLTAKEEDDRKWFEKGEFEDGYQFGDLWKTILGTTNDIRENATAGVIGMGEKIVDAGAYLAGGVGGLFGADEFKDKTADFIKKDLYDEEKVAKKLLGFSSLNQSAKTLGADSETSSVLGEKSDSLVQSAGQLGATAALQAVGVPWYLTTGVTSFGGEAENAFNEGAAYGEAGLSAAISAGAEILTEKISGGIKFGGKALDDGLTQKIARDVSSKAVRTLSKLGLDAGGEGFEEVLSGLMSAIGQKITYADDKELTELFSKEDAWESFVGGAVLGGGSNVMGAVKAKVNGVDAVTGLTANEQKVVDQEYKNRVAEAEKTGKQTEKQKSKIYDEVLRDMERGYISTDTIEEILGGESYKTYKDTIESEDALTKEYEELGKLTAPTLAEQTRYKELHEQMKNKDTSTRDQLKSKLSDEVMGLVKGDRLAESYNERSRRGQAFEADLTKYDAKQQETIKKAVESGILNNTNRTHEFVDMIAKITADKGVLFDFTNNAKLKESGFAVEGKTVNGYVTNDGISINIDSAKATNSVVGHEITHVLEGTELYKVLQQTVFDYAKSKGEFDSRHASLSEIYNGIEGANVDAELTADLVGDYLFTDREFVKNLSVSNRNVFQKIYDEIKYLAKVATAGSKEARELEKVKRAFEEAYRQGVVNKTESVDSTSGRTKYHISNQTDTSFSTDEIRSIQSIGRKSVNDFDSKDIAATEKFARRYYEEMGTKSPFYRAWFGDWRNKDTTPVQIATERGDLRGIQKNEDTGWDIQVSGKIFNETKVHTDSSNIAARQYLPYINDIVKKAVLLDSFSIDPTKPKSENSLMMHSLYAVADIGNGQEILKLYVEEMNNPNATNTTKRGYQLQNIEKYRPAGKSSQNTASSISPVGGTVSTVADLFENVKQKDRSFNPSDASKIVNADGTPKVMYHGSPMQFTVFDKKKAKSSGHYGRGFYFSNSETHAGTYGNTYRVYLNIRNPLQDGGATVSRDQVRSFLEAVAENEDYSIENYGTYDIDAVLENIMGQENSVDAFKVIQDVSLTAVGDMVEAAELFNDVNGTTFDGIVVPTETVAFRPDQIKSATDNIGTFDKSNPDILYSLSDGDYSGKSYAAIVEEQNNLYKRENDLRERKQKATNDPELLQALDDYSSMFSEMRELLPKRRTGTATQEELNRIEELKTLREEKKMRITELQEQLGLGEIAKEEAQIREEREKLRIASDEAWEREGAEKENKAIEKSGMTAQEYFRKKALKAFKTTTNFNEAGYLLPDGKMLNFSGGERNHRYRDHREIGEIYEATQGTAALNRFLNDGNIRIMAESPGIDLASGVEPTVEQYAAIRKFVNSHGAKDGKFFVDFSGTDGRKAGNYSYEGRVNADRVINDIKYYYATGEIRAQSDIGRFLSLSNTGEASKQYGNYNVYGKDIALEAAPEVAPVAETKPPVSETEASDDIAPVAEKEAAVQEEPKETKVPTRKELHQNIVDGIKARFSGKGFDFDKVLKSAKNLPTFSTVDNTPQRVMEKALGYKEGQILSDLTVNKVAQNETEGIKWLNSFTDRNNGILKQISKQYGIKPGSKESAAAQMYAEGFYVAENNDIIEYGDAELAKDFPDAKVQANIKGLAGDARIRQIYDDTLAMINESRTRNAYPEIPRLDNYFLHFRAMDDTFSRLGLPFNPNDIRAKDLPTDLNGVTADLKPGQPYFASAMHRTGKRTSFDLLGGLERYLTSAKNQIYHIDDIQTLRALRNYIADTYGQANGLEGLDALSEEEAQDRIEKVYDSHLSTFAKFLNEEANILAGKTALIDRGLEGIIGRRGITFLNTLNGQVGSNMVGYNISSSLTNLLPVTQTFAKTNKFDFVKAFAQTVANKTGSLFGKSDGFAEQSPVMIRRKGADRFYRTAWQKVSDPGYALMGAVDSISTELIARTKYNELTRKGMDSQKAHYETDKWVSRMMGDRSLGQQPQLYNSKMLGLVTKFQLEVRNQLDSQFYDTIQEAKVSNEDIQNGLARNTKTAAKVASTFVQLAVAQHLFGKAFESVAGYNPAFDIIEVLMTTFGWDDEEDSEDTALDNIEEGFLALLEDLPYTSTLTGGRIPISSALPVKELVKGVDEWGNEKSRWETLGEVAPYYLMPGGYGQVKKTTQGLSMFSDEHPVAGSYTDSGNLRFPVEDTLKNRIQAGIFGQWASENAGAYFDNSRSPLNAKQIQEYSSLGVSYDEYWAYRDDMNAISKRAEKEGAEDDDVLKAKYISSVDTELSAIRNDKLKVLDDPDLTAAQKETKIAGLDKRFNSLANDRYKSYNDISYDGDYANIGNTYYQWYTPENGEAYWRKLTDDQVTKYKVTRAAGDSVYATDGSVHYRLEEGGDWRNISDWTKISDRDVARQKEVTKSLGITPEEYWSETEISYFPMKQGEYEYAYENPDNYTVAKAVGGYDAYKGYSSDLSDIKADKDSNGKSISGSRKEKVLDYINGLDIDYGEKLILFKNEYNADDTYNYEIIDYLNSREDLSYEDMETILKKLGFNVSSDGTITW